MALIADIASWVLLMAGAAFVVIGALGVVRLPDVFSRMHAAGMIDTAGAGLILAGLMVQGGFSMVTVKLVLIVAFLLYTSPTATHALAGAALYGGQEPQLDEAGEAAPPDIEAPPDTETKETEPSKT